MASHYYPVIYFPDELGGFGAIVPDIAGCLTQGESLTKAMYWTVDAIGTMLDGVEEKDYPPPSKVEDIDLSEYPGAIVNVIEFNSEVWKVTFNRIRKARTPLVWLQNLIVEKIESSI